MNTNTLLLMFLLITTVVSAIGINENNQLNESKDSKVDDITRNGLGESFPRQINNIETKGVVPRKSAPGLPSTVINTTNSSISNDKSNSSQNITEVKSTTNTTGAKIMKQSEVKEEQNKVNSTFVSKKPSNDGSKSSVNSTTIKPIHHKGREGVSENVPSTINSTKITPKTENTSSKLTSNEKVPISDNKTTGKTLNLNGHESVNISKSDNSSAAVKLSSNANATSVTTGSTTTTLNTTTKKTTTTTSTTTTTTTTLKPKKPKITFSVEDMPSILDIVPDKIPNKLTGNLNVEEPEQPIAQPSKELDSSLLHNGHKDYIIPIVALIFSVPVAMGAFIIVYRKMKDYWYTRHYRRMDFLVDGMYND